MYLLKESSYEVETLTENTSTGKRLYLEGIFMQANLKNRNGRIYPKPVMEQAVDRYISDYINRNRAIGEIHHPTYPLPDMENAAIMIESLSWDGDNVIGKAKVMSTPKGQILEALLSDGYSQGVSSRGLGAIQEVNGQKIVNQFILNAIDYVDMPSGIDCFPDVIYESENQWINESGIWVQKESKQPFNESMFLNNLDKFLENLKKNTK